MLAATDEKLLFGDPHLSHLNQQLASGGSFNDSNPLQPDDSNANRRSATVPGSRSVSTLTPQQLARKRAHDREAQRATRERRKQQIDTLEQALKDREHDVKQLVDRLGGLSKDNEELKNENSRLRGQLEGILGILRGNPQADITSFGISLSPPPVAAVHDYSSPASSHASTPMHHYPAVSVPPVSTVAVDVPISYMTAPMTEAPVVTMRHHSPTGGDWSNGSQVPRWMNMETIINEDGPRILDLDEADTDANHSTPSSSGDVESWVNAVELVPHAGHITSMPPLDQTFHNVVYSIPPTLQGALNPEDFLPRNTSPTCTFDALLLSFISSRLSLAPNLRGARLIGPAYPRISDLTALSPRFPRRNLSPSSQPHVVSKFFTDFMQAFPAIDAVPEQIATTYLMYLLMQYQISPSAETLARLPVWMRPTPTQVNTPHPAWIDHIPFPHVRDRIINMGATGEYGFDELTTYFSPTISLNWRGASEETYLVNPSTGEATISMPFEQHLRNIENWTLGPEFLHRYPSLAGALGIKPKKRDMV